MLLWLLSAVVLLLIPLEAADEDDARAGTQHPLGVQPPATLCRSHASSGQAAARRLTTWCMWSMAPGAWACQTSTGPNSG